MARIRSIHPGIWTDEAFMSLSAYARLLYIGLWAEAYDDGVFEWKPLTLKARLFPVDSVNVPELLVELYNAGLIERAEQHPKQPGLIRNFQKFQRPKKPNSSGMLEERWRDYVGASSAPVPNQSGTGTENPPQMEDGGGSKEDVGSDEPTSPEPGKPAPVVSPPIVIELPCVSGEPYPVTEADVAEWGEAFPAVDVRQQLAAMRQWLVANPTRRKTRRGMRKFVVSWLDRRQNAGGTHAPRQTDPPPSKPTIANIWTSEAKTTGLIDEPSDPSSGRLGAGNAAGHYRGTVAALDLAVSADRTGH